MPIKVTCQCGKSFAAKDELAGKAVKCPNCQQPLRIPAAGIAAPLPSTAPRPAASAASSAPSPHAAGSLFDEVGLKAAPAGAMLCPGCAQPIPQNAVLCIKCGYNLKLGRRMETLRFGEGGGVATAAGARGAATADLMNKASVLIEEDKEAERSKTKEGMPWWVYLIGLLMVVGFIILMMVIPQRQAIQAGGITVIGIGVLVGLYGWIRVLVMAFQEHVGYGLMVFFFGCFGFLIYTIMRWDKCGGYFLMWLGGQVVQSIGYGVLMLGNSLTLDNDAAYVVPPYAPPTAVIASLHPGSEHLTVR